MRVKGAHKGGDKKAQIHSKTESQGRGALASLPPASKATLSFCAQRSSPGLLQAAGCALRAVGAPRPTLAAPALLQPPPRRPSPSPRARSPSPHASPLSSPLPSLPSQPGSASASIAHSLRQRRAPRSPSAAKGCRPPLPSALTAGSGVPAPSPRRRDTPPPLLCSASSRRTHRAAERAGERAEERQPRRRGREGARGRPTGSRPGCTEPACPPGPSPPWGHTCGRRDPGQRRAGREWRVAPGTREAGEGAGARPG